MLVQFDLAGNHITELLSVLLLASEIGNHVPEILIEVAGPFFVAVTSIDLSERFFEKCRSQPFIPMVVVLPQGDKQQPVIIQCFHIRSFLSKTSAYSKYSINSLVYWVTYVHNVVYSFYRSMIYCYINSTQRCAGSIVIDIIPTNGADKRKFFPFAPYFPVTNVIKRYFYPYFPAIIGIKGYSFPYFPYLSGIMKIKTALYSLFSRLDWHKTVVFPCLGEIYEGIRSLSWEIPVT